MNTPRQPDPEPRGAGASHRRAVDRGTPELGIGLLAVSVGNTNTRLVVYHSGAAGHAHEGVSIPNADLVGVGSAIMHAAEQLSGEDRWALVIASTNHRFRDELVESLAKPARDRVFLVGTDIGIPVRHALSDEAFGRTGQDRLLNALGAFELCGQACAVVSAGTAMTIDFVDGQGVYQGGAITPGLRMWLKSMHDGTAALPLVEPRRPDSDPFAKSTEQAMLTGAFYGIRGVVRSLVERYAEAYEAYPRVIATGGDAPFLFEGDDLIDRIDPDLTLRGIASACRSELDHAHPGDA